MKLELTDITLTRLICRLNRRGITYPSVDTFLMEAERPKVGREG